MPDELTTPRLKLVALSKGQLSLYLDAPAELEAELGFPVSRDIVDAACIRAINIKVAKMAEAKTELHNWFTYWLIVVQAVPFGAGVIGFKGSLGPDGRAEVGYGIDTAYRNRGYMTEALAALTGWAFKHPECRGLTASTVSNPASEKVLRKSGWQKISESPDSSDWECLNSGMG